MKTTEHYLPAACLIIALSFVTATRAHEGHDDHDHPPVKYGEKETHRPTPVPDRIILTWKGNPATSQAVSWRTDVTVKQALAQIALADDGPKFVLDAKAVPATTVALTADLDQAHYHSVNFEDLQPATKYVYRVGDGANWSEWIHFMTADDDPAPFSFIYFGDAQNDIKSLWSRVIREAYSDAPKAKFMIHAGDLINRGDRDAEWGEWFQGAGWVNAMVPSIPSPGNHEYSSTRDGDQRGVSAHWRPSFTLPEHGPPGLEETAYWIDYQGVRIVSLNSNEKQEEQVPWLESVLSDNRNTWTVLTFHHPIYSSARDRDNPRLRALWQPIFDRYHVDLVLQGHDHTYGRSDLRTSENVATGESVRDPQSGTVYVVSVSGPKMYNLNRDQGFKRAAEDTQLYQIISVNGSSLRYEARTAKGDLYDAFTLNKRPGQANELVEQIPNTPERLRPAPPVAEAPVVETPADKPAPAETPTATEKP